MPAELAGAFVIGRVIEHVGSRAGTLRYLNGGDLQVIPGLAGGVGAEQDPVGSIGLALRPTAASHQLTRYGETSEHSRFFVGEPLAG
jgi:hypothetical protein